MLPQLLGVAFFGVLNMYRVLLLLLLIPLISAQENQEQIEEVKVSVSFIPDEKRDTSEISSVISAEAISIAGDSEASDALKRVTGLSLVKGKYVFVRG